MPISFGPENVLTRLVYETANFASGGGTTTLGWQVGEISLEQYVTLAEGVVTAWNDNMKAGVDGDITLASVQWESADLSGEVPAGLAGTASVTGPPPNAALLCTYSAIGKGPRNRGRSYWPGMVAENAVDERGVITPVNVTNLQTRIDDFFTDVLAVDGVLYQSIAQSITPQSETPPILPWPQVFSRVVQPVMATQRRRMRR